jgi:hypothetical protein
MHAATPVASRLLPFLSLLLPRGEERKKKSKKHRTCRRSSEAKATVTVTVTKAHLALQTETRPVRMLLRRRRVLCPFLRTDTCLSETESPQRERAAAAESGMERGESPITRQL